METLVLLQTLILFVVFFPSPLFSSSSSSATDLPPTSIVFATLGRAHYSFDVFTLPISPFTFSVVPHQELQFTDGESVNYNGFFHGDSLLYVSERNGMPEIFVAGEPTSRKGRRSVMDQVSGGIPVVPTPKLGEAVSMKDRPSIAGDRLIYVSTERPARESRKSWAAVYSTHLETLETRRLTPDLVADFSPAVSPSGQWTAVASSGERGWSGEIHELATDIYLFNTSDGSGRFKLVDHGGWPSFSDESTVFFHRQSDDGWWSVFRAVFRHRRKPQVERVTPPGVHAFTPAASRTGKFIVVATRRADSTYRHIEIFDLVRREFVEVSKKIAPHAHHYNPFISADSTRIGYHRCRGTNPNRGSANHLLLENVRSPIPSISLFRIDGSFPSFSPDGERIAFIPSLDERGVYIVKRDGSGRRRISDSFSFGTAWDYKRKNVVYTSVGPTFSSEMTSVNIVSISFSDSDTDPRSSRIVTLTRDGNNAFPSPSPDGKFVVFRSGRSGHKNLYVMDAVEGESGGLWRLTEGNWTDTMCSWSPDGEWISFASDRDDPGSGSFEIYLIHPNRTGLRKLVQSGTGGRTNHPWFSPDSSRLVFTSDYAAVSAEPISNPHHYQPYGDIFTIRLDGSGIRRMTHNSYEDGTPTWGSKFIEPYDVVETHAEGMARTCKFGDCMWLEPVSNAWTNGSNSAHLTKCG
ncbi:uncharacterized protein LOC116266930 [Nymphaea colorata]|nr:uncharacterized protein LOC116266930 [Nymphaea colorata]